MTNNPLSQSRNNEKRCFKCNNIGHFASSCKLGTINNKLRVDFCGICKKNNHSEKDYFFNKNKNMKSKNVSFLSLNSYLTMENCFYTETFKNEWVIDSGSSSHLSNIDGIPTDCKEVSTEINVATHSESMDACKIGTL